MQKLAIHELPNRRFPALSGRSLRRKVLAGSALAWVVLVPPTGAQSPMESNDPVTTATSWSQPALELRGEATYRWYFFKLYEGALYLPPSVPAERVFDPVPKRLVLTYARNVPLEKIIAAGNVLFAKNTPPEVVERLQPKLTRMNEAFREPEKGDQYELSYEPGTGTVLRFNDEVLTTIEGEEFARYYFRIWLGEHPVGTDFRDALLGVS